MNRYYRTLSFVLASSLLISCISFSASASDLSANDDNLKSTTHQINGEEALVEYSTQGTPYTRITWGENITERIGNTIYVNGEIAATIHARSSNNSLNEIEPRTGWMPANNPPLGSADEYNHVYYENEKFDLTLSKSFSHLTVDIFASILIAISPADEFAVKLAKHILNAVIDTAYGSYTTLYYTESKYGYDVLPNYARRTERDFYFNDDYSPESYACHETLYWTWG